MKSLDPMSLSNGKRDENNTPAGLKQNNNTMRETLLAADKPMVDIAMAVGRLPLAMEIAIRRRTHVFGCPAILYMLQSHDVFSKSGCFYHFAAALERKIRKISKDKVLALMALAIAVRHKTEVHYDAPYYAVPTALLPRLWNVGDAKMRCLFQGLLDNGFVCYKEIVPNDAVKGKRTTPQSYILIHTLVARFLDSILPSSHQVQLDDGSRGRYANFLVHTPGYQNSNRLQITDVADTSYAKLTNDNFSSRCALDFSLWQCKRFPRLLQSTCGGSES